MAYVKDKARPWSIIDEQITGQSDSWKRLVTVTPSAATVYSPRLQAIYVGAAGDVVIENSNLDQVTISAAADTWHFVEVRRVISGPADIIGAS